MLPRADTTAPSKTTLFDNLPPTFDRTTYIQIAQRLCIPESTADKQIARFVTEKLLVRQTHDNYAKP